MFLLSSRHPFFFFFEESCLYLMIFVYICVLSLTDGCGIGGWGEDDDRVFCIENKDIGNANRYKERTQREPAGGGDV